MTKSEEREFDRIFPMDSGILWIDAHPERAGPPADYQHEIFHEIMVPFTQYLFAAVKTKDYDLAIRLIVRAEQILDHHTQNDFDLFLPTQRQFQADLRRIGRFARRELIRRTLTCTEAEYPKFIAMLERVVTDDFDEDWEVVKRALAEGRKNIFDDLRR
jgi:hypothetical protein